jgi:hypothetical protein
MPFYPSLHIVTNIWIFQKVFLILHRCEAEIIAGVLLSGIATTISKY